MLEVKLRLEKKTPRRQNQLVPRSVCRIATGPFPGWCYYRHPPGTSYGSECVEHELERGTWLSAGGGVVQPLTLHARCKLPNNSFSSCRTWGGKFHPEQHAIDKNNSSVSGRQILKQGTMERGTQSILKVLMSAVGWKQANRPAAFSRAAI